VQLRPIQPADQTAVAEGILEVYGSYDCAGPGYGPSDADMKDLSEFYRQDGHFFLVAESDQIVIGGCGYAPFGPPDQATCELRKLFLLPAARGLGVGQDLLLECLKLAANAGYRQCYLETVERMQEACGLYQKHGFERLGEPLFGGGHHRCERWYRKILAPAQVVLLVLALLLPACSSGGIPAPSEPVQVPELRVELMQMEREDQQLREALIEKGISNISLADVYGQQAVDARHTSRLKEIVARYGWPGIDLVGKDGAGAAFLLIQHADQDLQFQTECLELMESAWKNGQAEASHYAELTDRVRVAQGEPQDFGTQAHIQNGKLEFYPIRNRTQVDQRRAAMGLMPLLEYQKVLEQAYLIRPN
jgi:putative acetyltransferase